MSQINPFTGAAPLPPTLSVADQLRRSKAAAKNLPADEAAEHVVENPDAVVMISEDASHQSPQQHEQPKHEQEKSADDADEKSHLDVTA